MTNFERLIANAGLLEKEARASLGYLNTFDKITGQITETHFTTFTGGSFPTREEALQAAITWLESPTNE